MQGGGRACPRCVQGPEVGAEVAEEESAQPEQVAHKEGDVVLVAELARAYLEGEHMREAKA